jgi:putative lipoic acid-binding regulatory protein
MMYRRRNRKPGGRSLHMDRLPAIELLEATHAFPCPYMFKVIGLTDENFVGRVLHAVRSQLAEDAEPPFSTRKTAGGRHVSVTIEPTLDSADHVLAIYRELSDLDGLVLML